MQLRSFFNVLFLVSGWLISFAAAAQWAPVRYQWATGTHVTGPGVLGAGKNVRPSGLAVSPNGDVFIGYEFTDTLTVNGQTFPMPSTATPEWWNAALIWQSQTGAVRGELLWGSRARILSVRTDVAGNVYAMGRFRDSVRLGAISLVAAAGNCDYFVAKWNAAGAVQWVKHGQTTSSVGGMGRGGDFMVVDDAGRVTVAATVSSPLTFDATVLDPTVPGAHQTVCVQFNPAGTVSWSRVGASVSSAPSTSWRLPNYAFFTSLAVEPATGMLVLAGERAGAGGFTWDGHVVTTDSVEEIFWLRLHPTGAYRASFASPSLDDPMTGTALVPRVAAAENGCSFLMLPDQLYPNFQINNVPIPPAHPGHTVVARLDSVGTPQWIRVIGPGSGSSYAFEITSAPQSGPTRAQGLTDLYVGGTYSAFPNPLQLDGTAQLPVSLGSTGFVAALDAATGSISWAVPAAASLVGGYSGVLNLSVDDTGELTIVGYANDSTASFPGLAPLTHASGNFGFTARLTQQYNRITGRVFADANANGAFDAGERTFTGLPVEAQPANVVGLTNANGDYSVSIGQGGYSAELPSPPPYYTLPPTPPAPVTFTGFGTIAAGRDFALQPIAGQQDLQVFLTSVTPARPGFALRYRVTYHNVGTTTLNGTVVVQLDSSLTYVRNSAGGTLAGRVLTVAYPALAPGANRAFDIELLVPASVALGTALGTTATIGPLATDVTAADNVATDSLTVVGSYDPNDIAVNHATLSMAQVAAGEWLEYTIRFENMGTDTAFSVLLRDSLPLTRLDLGTLQFIAWSHNCSYRIAPGGWLIVQFPNILLPSRVADPLNSTGFVRFRVRPRNTLISGDQVPNQAGIHFDYNAPVVTNTALTTVLGGLGLSAADAASGVSVWPNPTSGTLNVETAAGASPVHLTLLDNVGRTVRTLIAPDARRRVALDVRGLPAGLYLLRGQGTTGGAGFTRRVVVR